MRLSVNGRTHDIAAEPSATLLSVLREHLALTGTKLVCDRGECGACTVLLEKSGGGHEPAYACLTLAAACEGRPITTIEGLGSPGAPHPLQEAFVRHDALQCGFCTPGQILAAAALLERTPSPTESEVVHWMSGNLCRCGAYPKIVAAILDVAASANAGEGAPARSTV